MNRLVALSAAVLALGIAAYLVFGGNSTTTPVAEAPAATATTGEPAAPTEEAAEVDISTIAEMTLGNPDARVTVIEYASYTCPHCATFHNGPFKQLKTDYIDTGKIEFVYREVYFDRFGLWASMLARCAGPDRFFAMTDLIYQGQDTWARAGDPALIAEELRKIGRLVGLDAAALDACLLDDTKALTLVAWFQANAEEHGIESTPSFVIDGKTYGNMSYADMSGLIDAALAE